MCATTETMAAQQPATNALPLTPSSVSRSAGRDQQTSEETNLNRHNDQDCIGESLQSAPEANERGSDIHLRVAEHGERGGEGVVLQQTPEGEAPESELLELRHGQLVLSPSFLLLPLLPSLPGDATLYLWRPPLAHVSDVALPDVRRLQTGRVWNGSGSV